MNIFQWQNIETNPRAHHIYITKSLRHPLHFPPCRKLFELKRLVPVCSKQLSVELYKLYVCRFVFCFAGLAEMFREQTYSAERTWREALSVLTPDTSSSSVGIQGSTTCGIYKRTTLNSTGYWKAISRLVLNVLISCNFAYKRTLLKWYTSAKKY